MPVKKSINDVFNRTVLPETRKEMARNATKPFVGQESVLLDDNPSVKVISIPLEKIHERDINEFSNVSTVELEQSIYEYSLINPISVFHKANEDSYTISSGHRRYVAMCNLHKRYPNDERFKAIDCRVYIITDKEFELDMGLPYITAEQEAAIYRDSNLLSRQLTYQDVAKQIRQIVRKFDDPDYYKKIQEAAKEAGITSGLKGKVSTDRVKLITSVLSSQNYDGWKSETIRCYLKIYDNHRDDLLDRLESDPSYTVKTAYKVLTESQRKSRHRKTNKLPSARKAVEMLTAEAGSRKYTEKEIAEIKEMIDSLQNIVEKNEEH